VQRFERTIMLPMAEKAEVNLAKLSV